MLQCWTLEIIPSSYMLLPRLPMYLPIAHWRFDTSYPFVVATVSQSQIR